jgi:hypothetical protein
LNTLEDRLRDAYRAAAEIVRPETLPPNATLSRDGHGWRRARLTGRAYRGRSRRRVLIPAAAAVAVIAVAATVSALLPRAVPSIRGRGPATSQTSAPTILSTPSYFVAVNWRVHPTMFVVNATTGAQGAQISLPFPATDLDGVATGDGQTFVVAASPAHGCSTSLYRFSLGADGTVSAMTLFMKVTGVIGDPWSMALSASGQFIAYDTLACGPPPRSVAQQNNETGYLSVLNTVTGQTKQWTYKNTISDWAGTGNVSISADGSVVGFRNTVLDTGAAPGTLAARGRVVVTPGEFGPSVIPGGLNIAPNGQTAYFATFKIANDKPLGNSWQLRTLDLATGQTRLVRSYPGTQGGPAAVTFDPTGRYMVVEYVVNTGPATNPPTTKLALVDIATGQATPLNASWAVDPAIAW